MYAVCRGVCSRVCLNHRLLPNAPLDAIARHWCVCVCVCVGVGVYVRIGV